MTPPKLAIDIDGVCARFDDRFAALLTTITGKPCRIDEPDCWEWPKKLGFSNKEERRAWEHIAANPAWWAQLSHYPDSVVGFQAFVDAGWDIYFITARKTTGVKAITEQWLKHHYPIDCPTVITSSMKGVLCKVLKIDAFIDDKPEMTVDVKLMNPKIRVYLRQRPHNEMAQPYLKQDGIILTDSLQTFFDHECERLRQSFTGSPDVRPGDPEE